MLGSVISTLMTFSLVSLQEPENMLAKYGLCKENISCIRIVLFDYLKYNQNYAIDKFNEKFFYLSYFLFFFYFQFEIDIFLKCCDSNEST